MIRRGVTWRDVACLPRRSRTGGMGRGCQLARRNEGFMAKIRLGLIGDNIAASQAPRLHALAGALRGIEVRYDLLVPAEFGL